ncbi:endonuclease MutS2 [Coprothermobacter platensis]|uniref:endonuclease MutS2 n=1 Tax=Coprothermobacter platensis TaxID=108819 RepID=UPI00037E2E1F|nr:endonuclease MutS2 [Coprothermobacter platensis]
MRDDLASIEFDKIVSQIKGRAASDYGQRYLDSHQPSSERAQVEKWLKETEEAWELIRKNVDPFVFYVPDVDSIISLLEKQAFVSIEEFLSFVKAVEVLTQLRNKVGPEQGLLGGLAKRIVPLDDWVSEVRAKVDESGYVRDDASRKLSDIRRDQKRVQSEIQEKLQKEMDRYQRFLSDRLVVKRGNRYAIPVKNSNVSSVRGIVLDWSGSGQTAYVEPFAVVDLNNRLEELRFLEDQEIHRIFQDLCAELYPVTEELKTSLRILAEIDASYAKAKWGSSVRGTLPTISDEGTVSIKGARHPLIPHDKVVPVDIVVPSGKVGVILSGPNTGGKTVTLKTIGLFAALLKIGAPVPALEAQLPLYDSIFTDIGDQQSIESSLSTFASHIARLKIIVEEADSGDLVLIDELGSGTDPDEGAAIAEALVDFLVQRRVQFFIATHLWRLKTLAADRPEILNASVDFDLANLKPLYKLNMGVPGRSYALEIAQKYGMPDLFINTARSKLSEDHERVEKLIEQLQQKVKHYEELEKEISKLQAEVEEKNAKLTKELDQLESRKGKILEETRAKAKRMLQEADDQSRQLLKELSQQNKANQRAYQIREQIKNMLDEAVKEGNGTEIVAGRGQEPVVMEIREGDTVYVSKFKQLGLVLSLSDDTAEVQIGPLRATVARSELSKAEPKREHHRTSNRGIEVNVTEDVPMKLEVHGLTVDEALERVDKYLDQAYAAGLPYVYIIHGRGTGTLQRAIHEYLREHPHVSRFRFAEPNEGGTSVTMVYFK